jgi:large subunit ribosomal protein L29
MRDSFNELSYKELLTKKAELTKRHYDLRFNVVVGHVENTLEERNVRKKLARLNTLIHEFNIGIRKQ